MANDPPPGFRFVSQACPEAGFRVVRFEGREELGRCYRFRIELASARQDLDLNALMGGRATFTILRQMRTGRPDLPFHGVLLAFRQLHQAPPHTFYEAILVPRLHLLSLTRHNQVFLDQSPPEFIAACLKDGGLEAGDFRFALAREAANWEKWDYLCQYGESHLDFVQRWLEREGLYYFFEQEAGAERVVITDSRIVHRPRPGEPALRYHPAAGLAGREPDEVILEFSCRRQVVPRKVVMRDLDHLAPSIEIRGEASVSPHGHGPLAFFGEHLRSPREGARLAELRAEEARCRETRFEGRGQAPSLQPGYPFRLQGHYRTDWDGHYLAIEVRHRGGEAGFMTAGLGRDLVDGDREPGYENRFTALPVEVQFRLPLATPGPRIHGVLSATVDAEGDRVHLDAWSRYKIRLPFDRSGRGGGKASAWVRMLGPYAGVDHGWNSPLHKGTEVLLAFIDGDPDRPVIAGAVPNPRTPSPVNVDNASQVVLQTSAKSRLEFENRPGLGSIQINCPTQKVFWHINQWGIDISVEASWTPSVGTSKELILGHEKSVIGGLASSVYVGLAGFMYLFYYRHYSRGINKYIEKPDMLHVSNERKHLNDYERQINLRLDGFIKAYSKFTNNRVSFEGTIKRMASVRTSTNDIQLIETKNSSQNELETKNIVLTKSEKNAIVNEQIVKMEEVGKQVLEKYDEEIINMKTANIKVEQLLISLQNDSRLIDTKSETARSKTEISGISNVY